MQTNPPANERQSLWRYFAPRTIGTALRRFWRWVTFVHSADPIRQALSRGFASIITLFIFISVVFIFASFAAGEIAAGMVTIVSIPVQIFIWWLNRQGTIYGAAMYVLWLIAA